MNIHYVKEYKDADIMISKRDLYIFFTDVARDYQKQGTPECQRIAKIIDKYAVIIGNIGGPL